MFPLTDVVDGEALGIFGLFVSHLTEESSEAVIVIHGPSIERMIVTLSTLDACAHKTLEQHSPQSVVASFLFGSSSLPGFLASHRLRNNVADDLVDILPLCTDSRSHWSYSRKALGLTPLLVLIWRSFCPAHHPKIIELLALQQLINPSGSLVESAIRYKFLILRYVWQQPDEVQRHASQKGLITAQSGGAM